MRVPSKKDNLIHRILAADARTSEVSPINDHIWELSTGFGEPPALAFQTTYGLRAINMRLFPRFIQNNIPTSDPRSFSVFPTVTFSAPNFIHLNFMPVTSVDVNLMCWVPNSQTLVGQVNLLNTGAKPVSLKMEWVAMLKPMSPGTMMTAVDFSVNKILSGRSQNLFPVLFLTGGPSAELSYSPSLGVDLTIAPGVTRQLTWALTSLESMESSFYCARKFSSYSLDAEQLKIEMTQKAHSLTIESEEHALEERVRQSNTKVMQVLLPPFNRFRQISYCQNRLPDHGYSSLGDGSDVGSGWGIQSVLDVWILSRMLLPANPELLRGFIQNFIDQQSNDGSIDFQITWNANHCGLFATPLLASMALDLSTYLPDKEWIKQVYPNLIAYIKIWFDTFINTSLENLPSWKNLLQTGIVPMTDTARTELETLIETAEFPSLAALLIHECECLIKIGEMIEDDADLQWLQTQRENLVQKILPTWDDTIGAFQLRSKVTHKTEPGKTVHVFRKNGDFNPKKPITNTNQVFLVVERENSGPRSIRCTITGDHRQKEVETSVEPRSFQWNADRGTAHFGKVINNATKISITGLQKGDVATLATPNFSMKDPTYLVPLWAGTLTPEKAELLIRKSGLVIEEDNQLRISPQQNAESVGGRLPASLKIMWIEGLMRYGFKELAGEFYKAWFLPGLTSACKDLDLPNRDAFSSLSDISTASIHDLAPLLPLLRLLGIEKLSADEIILSDLNRSFPAVTVKYNQVEVVMESQSTRIGIGFGEQVKITNPGPHRIQF